MWYIGPQISCLLHLSFGWTSVLRRVCWGLKKMLIWCLLNIRLRVSDFPFTYGSIMFAFVTDCPVVVLLVFSLFLARFLETFLMAQPGYLKTSRALLTWCMSVSRSFYSVVTVSDLWWRVSLTPILCSSGWADSKSVWVGLQNTVVLICPVSSLILFVS